MPGGFTKTFGLFHNREQIGFVCFAEYTPWRDKSQKRILHSNRLVIHPDYVGLGLGIKFLNKTSAIIHKEFRTMAKYSALPVFKAMQRNKEWMLIDSGIETPKAGKGMIRKSSFRQKVKWWSFEYVGEKS